MIVWLGRDASLETIGAKGHNLCRLAQAGLPVPAGFCVTVDGMGMIGLQEVRSALAELGAPAVAVRSSAVEEDASAASFAGIYVTRLNVSTPEETLQVLREIRDSALSPVAAGYREKRGLKEAPRMAAIVQTLITPETSGVLFTKHPIDGSDRIVIEGSWSLGNAVVEGTVTPDQWIFSAEGGLVSCNISDKDIAVIPGEHGTRQIEVDASRRKEPCLHSAELCRLLELACACKQLFGCPQDIEWAIASGKVWLLQSRPITR